MSATWFVDGTPRSLTNSNLAGAVTGVASVVYFGASAVPSPGHYATQAGWLSEVRISNTLRYASAFTPQKRFTPDANTVALYHLYEGGTALVDASGNGHDGTLSGSMWWDSSCPQ